MEDYVSCFRDAVRILMPGDPTSTHGDKVRYGSKGSLEIDYGKGVFSDFESETHGGVLDFIMYQTGAASRSHAAKWLEDHGLIAGRAASERPASGQRKTRSVAQYQYRDENGELRYTVHRKTTDTGERKFIQQAADGTWSIKGVEPLPYRLPEMLAAPEKTILITEGEKDADNLAALGFLATCNSGGAGKFSDKIARWFEGRHVVILPDNDDPGARHGYDVAWKLHDIAASVKILVLPDLPHKGDVSDWIASGGTREALIAMCKAVPVWEPSGGHVPEPEQKPEQVQTVYAPEQLMPTLVNTVEPLPLCNDSGKPLNHISNLQEIMRRLGVVMRYNVIAKEAEMLIPGLSFTNDNAGNASLAWLMSECSLFNYPTSNLGSYCLYLADQNVYNPVATWIQSKPWDGVERMQLLYNTIAPVNLDDNDLKETLIFKWMLTAVAAAFSPDGVSAAGMLVIQGDQYLGKTKWFKSLVPDDLGVLKDGMLLRPDNKDSVKQICSFWLVELGELDSTFKKSDIAQLKAFITSKSDVLRRAYAVKESHYARRTVFFGSVNPKQFLNDPTGNRRFWTIEAASIEHSHDIDMQQVWAEMLTYYLRGDSYYLTPEELDRLNSHNEEFTSTDPVVERITTHLDWSEPKSLWAWNTVTDILIQIGLDKPTQTEKNAASECIRKMNGDSRKRTGTSRLLLAPKPKRG